jgi:Zn-dependent peptidase ImmA (M78 family)|tara:strand:- start:13370 stop:13738 length:369 start_codon:yes stop_codon:yes gene_type:complete
MGYTMKSNIPELLGINPELSTYDIPVFEKDLEKGHWGAANRDRTIHVNKNISDKNKKHAVEHEMEHIKQFRNGTVRYDNKNIYYKPTLKSPINIIARNSIKEGAHNLPWEKAIYDKTKKYAK